ncbi:FAD-dependent pyridine nucleotide-disulfide oxidoreductase [Scytonema sp. HK-05]|uniref:NAD(P)/FAD-dependent oxidoreductase n=1 Tax=Scytonema sp. HK-05 TaxID=1137095 RepID=UPI000935B238|nr:NAD(P)/FAD-dependent oxidoreductase [Scytonema sp. HK-05]OKH58059.1 NADH dehydrogenase [Scytonema sp. HK-05]BAY47566.1 FAD-dependent pyridine nucleotide-disulfide oxidoreductase [Scytonema sp. HK-05]
MNNPVYQTVILGGGFTGLFTALHLAHEHYPRSVILIDSNDRFCFKPLLYEYFSGEMDTFQVVPRFTELLKGSGVIFVQDTVQAIDLHQRQVKLTSGTSYNYSNLVLGLGSVTGYFGVEGAKENALPFWTQKDAIAIDRHLRDCLQKAAQTEDPEQRRKLLTVAIIGGGPSGVEMAATLADLLPNWYAALKGNPQEVRVVLINHGKEILKGDINSHLRETAEQELQKRTVPIEMLLGAEATAIRSNTIEYKRDGKSETLPTYTTIWTAGTATHPLIKDLAIPEEHRDKHGRLKVTKTLQLPDFPEVFAGGDCAAVEDSSFPPTAQVAYQQGATIAQNLKAIALGNDPKPVRVNIRGTLLKLGLNDAAANVYNVFEVTGKPGHLIRQGTYLELLPTPIHDFKATVEWVDEEIFHRHLDPHDVGKKVVQAVELVGGAVVGVMVARKLFQMLGDEEKKQ